MSKSTTNPDMLIDDEYNKSINEILLLLSNNYILNGTITYLEPISDHNIYLVIIDRKNHLDNQLRILTEIASNIIKLIKKFYYNFSNYDIYYIKYNEYMCSLTILENNDQGMKFKIKLKYDTESKEYIDKLSSHIDKVSII